MPEPPVVSPPPRVGLPSVRYRARVIVSARDLRHTGQVLQAAALHLADCFLAKSFHKPRDDRVHQISVPQLAVFATPPGVQHTIIRYAGGVVVTTGDLQERSAGADGGGIRPPALQA